MGCRPGEVAVAVVRRHGGETLVVMEPEGLAALLAEVVERGVVVCRGVEL